MRIAIFNWRCFRHPQAGGSELYLHKQAVFWVRDGHEVIWFTSHPKGTAKHEEKDGITFLRGGGTFSVYGVAAFNYFRRKKPDVVIDVENGIPFFTPLYTRCPVVLLIHHVHTDVWAREAGWLTAKVGAWLEQKAMPMVYRRRPVVTVSDSSAGMIRDLFGRRLGELTVVHNGVSAALVPGEKSERSEIIYLGRLRRYKSIDVLLRAVVELKDLAPVLHLVGQGEDEPRLKKLAQELGLKDVLFHGFVSDEQKRSLLQQSWVAVNPSRMEGWGVTNIEANACGTPVIGADVPGIRDSVCEGKSGYLFPHGDVHALAAHLRKLIENPADRDRLSRSACDWAKRFSWSASAAALLTELEKAFAEDRKE